MALPDPYLSAIHSAHRYSCNQVREAKFTSPSPIFFTRVLDTSCTLKHRISVSSNTTGAMAAKFGICATSYNETCNICKSRLSMFDRLLSPDVLNSGCATYDRDIIQASAVHPLRIWGRAWVVWRIRTRGVIWDHDNHLIERRSCRASHRWRCNP